MVTRSADCNVQATAHRAGLVILALWLPMVLAAGLLLGIRPAEAQPNDSHTYHETFSSTTYQDAAQTTALWDSATGQLRLHPPLPEVEGVAGQLFYPTTFCAAVHVPGTDRIYLFGGAGDSRAIQVYDPATNSTIALTRTLAHELAGGAGFYVASEDRVYLLGGNLETTDITVFDVTLQSVGVLSDVLPCPISYASTVYVAEQQKAYIFGGMIGDSNTDAQDTIWEYDLRAGTVVTLPVALPVSPLSHTSAVYDPLTQSAYIFGGQFFGVPTQRIFKFSVASQVTVSVVGLLPAACSGASAVYVPEQQRAYVFGGQGSTATGPLSQTVEFDISSQTAIALPAKLPIERTGSAAVYVPTRGIAYVLAGQSGSQTLPLPLSDIVAFDVNAQSAEEIGTAIDGRNGASAIYVPDAHAVYLFGGRAGYESAVSRSILRYDVERVTTDVLSVTLPVSRTDTAAAYDADSDQAYIFGGWSPGVTPQYSVDVLRFDPTTETLSGTSSFLPSGRSGMSAVYVPRRDRVYLFGGVNEAGCVNQILVYDPEQDQLTPLSSVLPAAAAHAAAVYDELTNQIFLLGGWNPQLSGEYLDQIVAFDVETETATLLAAKLPFIRSQAAAFAIPGEGVAYVIGGTYGPGRHLGDVVRFDAITRTVTSVAGRRLAVPRSGHAALYVSEEATAYLFGGIGYGADRALADIVKLMFSYPVSETARSLRVNSPGDQVHQARLAVQQALRGGSVQYALSNDGGQTWAQVQPGARHIFAESGSDLRWRATLSGDGRTTPIIEELSINYNGIDWYPLFLPLILKVHGG
jgi:N-acetylneuraminic acid mutarotase